LTPSAIQGTTISSGSKGVLVVFRPFAKRAHSPFRAPMCPKQTGKRGIIQCLCDAEIMRPTHSLATSARQPRSPGFIPRFDVLSDITREATTCFPAEKTRRNDQFLISGIENRRGYPAIRPVVQSVFTIGIQVDKDRRARASGEIIDAFIHRAREMLRG
jgi:hypothetical protein